MQNHSRIVAELGQLQNLALGAELVHSCKAALKLDSTGWAKTTGTFTGRRSGGATRAMIAREGSNCPGDGRALDNWGPADYPGPTPGSRAEAWDAEVRRAMQLGSSARIRGA
jgi:hypothetical protein